MFFKSLVLFMTFIFMLTYYLYNNLGEILNITTKPSKTELLVCLGGGSHINRTKKTIELYKNGYLEKKHIVFTGIKEINKDAKRTFLNNPNVYIVKNVKNTMEEVLYIKDFMKRKDLKSVIFITEAPHSRRLKIFWDMFGQNMKDVKFSVVASEFKNWDNQRYYEDKIAKEYAYSEVTKLIYNFFVYGVLDKIGLKEKFETRFKEELQIKRREIISNFK